MARKQQSRTIQDVIASGERVRPSDLADIPLGDHDGVPITQFAARLTKAGDGLSEGMALTPIHLPVGTKVAVVVLAECVNHHRGFAKNGRERVDDERQEIAILEAEGALIVDPDLVADVADAHMKRIRAAREAAEEAKKVARGELRLEGMERPTSVTAEAADDYYDPGEDGYTDEEEAAAR